MNIISWNINGIRAIVKKDFPAQLKQMNPDVLCLQETKAQDDQVQEALQFAVDYHLCINSAARKGYSGVAILSKEKPLNVRYGIGVDEHDSEGRVVTAEFANCFVISVYVPNSGNGLARLDYRTTWDRDFRNYLVELEKEKPVVVCGDFNVAHQRIDIARPDANYNKTAGYTQKEIDGMTDFLTGGLVDTFRNAHPEEVKYSWWSYRGGARGKNIGWRLDYVLVSKSLINSVSDAFILNEVHGSDHCPVGVKMAFP
ncbi:MAG: exodeoxyribonuclease III [Cryomorphaceae bacterium]|nr:exodeoxyribonuclease III [Cryomorphaceae bacterium]